MNDEVEAIRQRYERRKQIPELSLYDPLNPHIYMANREKQLIFIRWIQSYGLAPVRDKR